MDAAGFAARAAEPAGLRGLAREALADQLKRLERRRAALVMPLTRRPFENYGKLHFHQGFELAVQCLGASRWELLEDSAALPRGALLFIPRGVPHREHLDEAAGCNCNVNFYVSQDLVTCHALAWLGPDDREMLGSSVLAPSAPGLLFDALAEAVAGHERGGAGSILVRGLLVSALSLLLESLSGPGALPEPGSRLVALCRQEVLRYLCSTALNVGWLAERLGCNADYLSHLFRRHTGQRLNHFIAAERLKLGRYLLQSSTLSVSEVALSCGYADPGYFGRAFRRAAGQTPGEFRRSALPAGPAPAGEA
jgi:AraC-like DNA-binding protein